MNASDKFQQELEKLVRQSAGEAARDVRVVMLHDATGKNVGGVTVDVGGWPGYHTHWTPIPDPAAIQHRFYKGKSE